MMRVYLKVVKTSKKRLKLVLGKFPFDRHTREIPEGKIGSKIIFN